MNEIDFEPRGAMNIYDDDEPHALVSAANANGHTFTLVKNVRVPIAELTTQLILNRSIP